MVNIGIFPTLTNKRAVFVALSVIFLAFLMSTQVTYAGELVKELKGECFYQCQDTNTTGPGTTTCTPSNATLKAVENKHKDPTHKACEQKQCGTASYSGSGGSGQEDRCKKMPGMPPKMPMPMPKMPMPKEDECMKPDKANTKECKCKKPENADDPLCRENKATTTLNFFGTTTDSKATQKSIVDYGRELFGKFFGNNNNEEDESDESTTVARGETTSVRNTTNSTGLSGVEPATFQSLQPPATPASPALQNASDRSAFIQSDTFGAPSNAAQDFSARADAAEAPGGIVSRIGAGARAIVNNLRNFFFGSGN